MPPDTARQQATAAPDPADACRPRPVRCPRSRRRSNPQGREPRRRVAAGREPCHRSAVNAPWRVRRFPACRRPPLARLAFLCRLWRVSRHAAGHRPGDGRTAAPDPADACRPRPVPSRSRRHRQGDGRTRKGANLGDVSPPDMSRPRSAAVRSPPGLP